MYHSKMNGKGCITHYDSELNQAREHQIDIENSIREGLVKEEFDVWYQPVMDAKNLSIVTVEALLRWPRRLQGSLQPEEFIPIAENSGLISPLGEFVLRRSCSDLQKINNLRLSVNISPAQFQY